MAETRSTAKRGPGADLVGTLSRMNASMPFEMHRTCDDFTESAQGTCVKDTFIFEDNHLGLLLAPFKYQAVNDRRFHVLFGPSERGRARVGLQWFKRVGERSRLKRHEPSRSARDQRKRDDPSITEGGT